MAAADAHTSPSWVVYDDQNLDHTDLLGIIIPATSDYFKFSNKYKYELRGGIPEMAAESYHKFSYYLVTAPNTEIPDSYCSPVKNLCEDLVTTPKTYSLFDAEIKTTCIIVSVKDIDGMTVLNAKVYLNASEDMSSSMANKITDENGNCTFGNLIGGDYNFSVSLDTDSGPQKMKVTEDTGTYQEIMNYVQLEAHIWTVQFNVTDIDLNPLRAGWVSINYSSAGSGFHHNISLNNGWATFRGRNDSAYNYSVFYNASGYNNGIPICLNSSSNIDAHINGQRTNITIITNMTAVNFMIFDDNLGDPTAIYAAIIRVCNSSKTDGSANESDILAYLAPADQNGSTQFYWLNQDVNSNYSLQINVGGAYNIMSLNKTDIPADDEDWTSTGMHYQNFTMTSTMNKTILVKLSTQAEYLIANLTSVDEPSQVYWGDKITFQALYQHNSTITKNFEYAAPSIIHYTLKQGTTILAGPADMILTSQTGRYEALVDTAALGLVVGPIYSILIEAEEGGYLPIEDLLYSF